jgi:flagellin-like hook-associated protein FlgL
MTISGVTPRAAATIQSLVDMRSQLNDLTRQLGTGKKTTTYSGLGMDAGLVIGLRSKLSAISGYTDTITNVNTRISLENTALSRISAIGDTVKGTASSEIFNIDSSGQTNGQKLATSQLDEILGLLNTPVGDRYLFSGRAVDTPAVENADTILNGDGSRAGFKQVMAERQQADLGADGLGRLKIPASAGSQVSVSEDAVGSVFGFKLASVNSTLTGATVNGPTGSPPGITVDLGTGNPNPGDAIKFVFNQPDGTTATLTLTATTDSPAGAGQFTIGADSTATAANLQAALTDGVGKLAATSLSAASSMAAANDFFDVDAGHPPQRVSGNPFTATSFTDGTPANTVTWYTGEMGTDSARGTAVAQVDDQLGVSYGVRANEQAISTIVKNIAVFASTTYSATDPNASDRSSALNQKLTASLAGQPGQQKMQDILSDLAYAQTTMKSASDNQAQRKSTLEGIVDGVEGVSQDQVAAQILTLQTQLQASLQMTSMLYQLSLVNYLN